MGNSNSSPDTGDASGIQLGNLGTGGTSSAGSVIAGTPALDPDLEKILRGHERPVFVLEPADLVWRRLSKIDARLRGLLRDEESLPLNMVEDVLGMLFCVNVVAMEFFRD